MLPTSDNVPAMLRQAGIPVEVATWPATALVSSEDALGSASDAHALFHAIALHTVSRWIMTHERGQLCFLWFLLVLPLEQFVLSDPENMVSYCTFVLPSIASLPHWMRSTLENPSKEASLFHSLTQVKTSANRSMNDLKGTVSVSWKGVREFQIHWLM